MGNRLEGKVAVVTGAGNGIGRAEALALAAEGAKVVVNDLGVARDGSGSSTSVADEVVRDIKRYGGEAVANYDTVTTAKGGQNIIQTALDSFGRIDILVNNAGFLKNRIIYNMTEEEWDTVLKVHLYGHFHCTKPACIRFRQQRGGRIINTSSTSGLGSLGQANYSAAKEGITGFTYTVAIDMARYGVTCNAICPVADTRGWDTTRKVAKTHVQFAIGELRFEKLQKMKPEMVAPLVVYLATDEAAYINGRIFWVAGGELGVFRQREISNKIYKDGIWALDELIDIVPKSLLKDELIDIAPKALFKDT